MLYKGIDEPSACLSMNICYRSRSSFSTETTYYGSKHEKVVLTWYLSNIHENMSFRDSGLFCGEVYPYFVGFTWWYFGNLLLWNNICDINKIPNQSNKSATNRTRHK